MIGLFLIFLYALFRDINKMLVYSRVILSPYQPYEFHICEPFVNQFVRLFKTFEQFCLMDTLGYISLIYPFCISAKQKFFQTIKSPREEKVL